MKIDQAMEPHTHDANKSGAMKTIAVRIFFASCTLYLRKGAIWLAFFWYKTELVQKAVRVTIDCFVL